MSRYSSATTITNNRTGKSLIRLTFGGRQETEGHKLQCKCEACEARRKAEAEEIYERMVKRRIVQREP